MSRQDAASDDDTLAFDPADWARRVEKARVRRAEALRRRRAAAPADAEPPHARTVDARLGPLADRLAEVQRDLAAGDGCTRTVAMHPDPAAPSPSTVLSDVADPFLFAERLDRLRQRMPSTAPIAGDARPIGREANADATSPSPAAPTAQSRGRLSQLSMAFCLGLAMGLPAAWLVPRLLAPVADAVAVDLAEKGPAGSGLEPAGGFAPPAALVEPRPGSPGGDRAVARAPRPVLPEPPVVATLQRAGLQRAGLAVPPARIAADTADATAAGDAIAQPAATGPAADALDAARLVVLVPAGSPGAFDGVAERLGAAGAREWSPIRSPHTVGQDHIRYYHADDRAAAEAAGSALGARVRDFTSFTPSPASGRVEVWLAGTGAGASRPATARASSSGDPVGSFARSVRDLFETFPANERP